MTTVAIDRPMTLDGAAEALGCSRRWLQGWLSSHPDHGYRIGRSWRFLPADIITMREAMKCRSGSFAHGKTKMVLGTSEGLSGDDALRKALALATGGGRKSSGRGAKRNSSTKPSTVVPLSRRSRTPLQATSSSEARRDS